MGSFFKCDRCGNTDLRKIGYLNCKPYCRACIKFKDAPIQTNKEKTNHIHDIVSEYELSEKQKDLSSQLVTNYLDNKNTLVNAVCGSGKTEIVLNIIKYVLDQGGNVGFAIPRKDVVIEICERLSKIFVNDDVIAVYGAHHEKLIGDIICLTTHQLFRYPSYFDLLIVDEIDAFPFKGSDILMNYFQKSLKGHYVLLSATPSDELINECKKGNSNLEILVLNERFHKYPLPVPKLITAKKFFQTLTVLLILRRFIKQNKPCFIFCPTIELCEIMFKRINFFIKGGEFVHSKRENRETIISDFKKGKYKFLVTTHVLERGVTVENLQVIIFNANHMLFDKDSLIQISGRVGRKIKAPTGEVIYIADESNDQIEQSIKIIKSKNQTL